MAGVPQKPEPKNVGISSEEIRRPEPGPAGRVPVRKDRAAVEAAGRLPLRVKARDVLFSLALCKSALLSEQAVCPIVSFGHSLGDSRPVPEGDAFRRVLTTASVNAGHSGLSSVFPANERSAGYSHIHEESEILQVPR